MTIGNDLDEQFIMIAQRLAKLEGNENETVLGIEADLTAKIEQLEAELNDRIDEAEGFDPDDLRCDLESQIEDVRDNVSYNDDRIDELEAYKCSEDEVEDIVERMLDDAICDRVTDAVCEEINTRAVGWTEYSTLRDRVKELEDRLNKPSLSGRIVRWLREGPSIKEVATNWYAGIRRGS